MSSAFLDKAHAWKAKLNERSDEIENNGQLPQDLADSLAKDGFYSILVPESYGGSEIDPMTFVDLVQTLAQGDASAAWCVMIGSTTGLVSGYVPEDVARVVVEPEVRRQDADDDYGRSVQHEY